MAYIGNQADTAFTSLIKQDLTGASGTSLTLTHAVANANDIALYINNVRQEPVSAYSTNGTAVSLTGSVVSSDDIYVIYLARAIQTTVTPDGSVSTAKIADSAVTNAKINNSTIDLTSKVTGVLPVANGGTGVSSDFTYSEGAWSPILTTNGTAPTYTATTNTGRYVRIGNIVHVSWYSGSMNISNAGSSGARISGLPFTASDVVGEYWLIQYLHGTALSGICTGGYVQKNNTNIIFIAQSSISQPNWVTGNGNRYVMISGAYRIGA